MASGVRAKRNYARTKGQQWVEAMEAHFPCS